MKTSTPKLYHEKQSTLKCAIHAVNNMLQQPVYNKNSFDQIAKELYKKEQEEKNSEIIFNPYKSSLGLGNYDVSVIEIAFLKRDFILQWLDLRKLDSFDYNAINLIGFLINFRGEKGFWKKLFGMVTQNHWHSIRKIGEIYYDLDSKLDEPMPLKSFDELLKILKYVKENDGFIFPIYKM